MTHLFSARTVRLTAALFAVACCFARPASAQYTFKQIVAIGAQFTGLGATGGYGPPFNPTLSLDADGSVAFAAATPYTTSIAGYYPGQGYYLAAPNGTLSTVVEYHGHVAYFGSLSYRSGRLAYSYARSGGYQLIVGPQNSPDYANGYATNGFLGFHSFAVSPDGIVAYSAYGSADGIYWSDGALLPTSAPYPSDAVRHFIAPGTGYESVRINRSHQVAIAGDAIRRGDTFGGPVVTLADMTGMFQSFTNAALSDNGSVTFSAALKSGGSGIFSATTGGVSTLIPASANFTSFSAISVNNGGQFAFQAALPGGAGIYTGASPAQNKVIATGDALDGKTVSALTFGVEGLNDRGQISFHTAFTDGSEAIYLASPPLLSGNVALEGGGDLSRTLAPLGLIAVEFRTPGATNAIFSATAPLIALPGSPLLSYSVAPPPPGTYDVAIKSDKSLRVLQTNVTINGAGTLADAFLPAGDANNDNSVDSSDFGLLIGTFNSSIAIPGSGYDPAEDFNYDGAVDSTDFGLLIGEYGIAGAL